MEKLTLVLMVVLAVAFVLAIALDSIVTAVVGVGYAIVWSAFHLGEKLDNR